MRHTRTSSAFVASSALHLCLTRLPELRIGAVSQQNVRAFLVVEHAAKTIAVPRRGKPRCDARFADGVDVRAFVDEQLQERVPSAIRGTEQRVLAVGRRSSRIGTELEEKLH